MMLLAVASSSAQMRDINPGDWRSCTSLHGVVSRTQGAAFGASVELRGAFDIAKAHASSIFNGTFDFDCVAAGDYNLRVLDISGKVIQTSLITVRGSFDSVHVVLSNPQTERLDSPWVSLRHLQRKVDKKAERELHKAYDAVERGSLEKAVQHSREAIARDPGYPEAWLQLGYAQARMERYEEAAEQFSKAAELDPEYVRAHYNLALAMLRLRRYDGAEQAARQALKLARPLPEMSFTLGVSLGAQRRNLDEAIEHLDRAAASDPRARLAAVRFLAEAGRLRDAATRLEQYLRVSGDTPDRRNLEMLLAQLK